MKEVILDVKECHPQRLVGHNVVVQRSVFTLAFQIPSAMAEKRLSNVEC
jgi:hypothetical protein